MIRSIQSKILIMFFAVGLVMIIGTGVFAVMIVNQSRLELEAVQGSNITAITEIVNGQITKIEILILIAILVFSLIMILVAIFVSQSITRPIKDMVENASKIANGESTAIIKRDKKRKTEVDDLANLIEMITGKLQDNLIEVNEQKREIEAVLEQLKDGIIAFDTNGAVTHINLAAKELLNLSEKDETFDKIFKKLNLDVKLDTIIYLEDLATTEQQRVKIKNKILDIYFATYKDEKDIQSGIIVLVQDVTEHVNLDNMRKEFVANVSHELKTPITSIIGYADTLSDGEYDRETENRFLKVISSEGNRMSSLVNDLLTLSKYDMDTMKREVSIFDLGELTKKCQEKLQIEIDKKDLKVDNFTTTTISEVKADKSGIERVILNVLSNAIKYTPEGGNIRIYVGFVYNDAYVKILDNGIGIPEDDLKRIFERFYRVDKARSREMGGTGLGLSIAKEIIEQNNGKIDIKSIYGEGTEVTIRIPAIKDKDKK